MLERIACVQAKFLLQVHQLRDGTLLEAILPQITTHSASQWSKLVKTQLWNSLPEPKPEPQRLHSALKQLPSAWNDWLPGAIVHIQLC